MSDAWITKELKGIAEQFRSQLRSPIMTTPAAAGLEFEDVTFPSEDGVPLEAWFIPREGSDKLIIVNHPKGFSRSGIPAHLEPWASMFAPTGNDFNVDFIPDYKILHDAGYNVLTYDLRNFGHSGSGNGGIGTSGNFESRDVIGSLDHAVREHDGMTLGAVQPVPGLQRDDVRDGAPPGRFLRRALLGRRAAAVARILP